MSSSKTPRYERSTPKYASGEIQAGVSPSTSLRVKESATELLSFQQNWERLHTTGTSVLNSIKTLKLDSLRHNSTETVHPQGLQERCDHLESVVNKLESCLRNLEVLVQQFTALVELDALQGGGNSAVFFSWTTTKFNQVFQDIYDAYSKEFLLKNSIKEDVAHCSTKESLIYHIVCWNSQPFLKNNCPLLIESLMYEASLR